MFISQLLRVRFIAALALALVFATAAYGFAAANTVPATGAGDGENTISGYEIQNVTYVLDTTDPNLVDKIEFNINPDSGLDQPDQVKVEITLANGANPDTTEWKDAVQDGVDATLWRVTLGSTQAVDLINLRVVATGQAG
jgi:archaellin